MKKLPIYFLVPLIALVSACSPTDSQVESRGTDYIRNNLNDPHSGNFRNVYLSNVKSEGRSKDAYVCGEVNAKNLFGAYVGYSLFYVHVSADTRFLIPYLGIAHGESDDGIVDINANERTKSLQYLEYEKRCK